MHAGTHDLLSKTPSLLDQSTSEVPPERESNTECRKNIGTTKRLRRWSRGHQFIVRAGGHIEAWQPLYKLVLISFNIYYV